MADDEFQAFAHSRFSLNAHDSFPAAVFYLMGSDGRPDWFSLDRNRHNKYKTLLSSPLPDFVEKVVHCERHPAPSTIMGATEEQNAINSVKVSIEVYSRSLTVSREFSMDQEGS